MQILIGAAGTMGDVAPFTGVGVRLQADGHRVAIAAYEPFGDLIRGCGLEFRPLPGDPQETARSEENQRWERGGGGARGGARLITLLARSLPAMNDGFLDAARQGADLILLSQLSMLGGYSIAQGLGIPSVGTFVVPVHPTGDFPPPLGLPSMGRITNRAAGRALLSVGFAPFAGAISQVQDELGIPRQRPGAMFAEQDAREWPVLYGFSSALLPRPADWRAGLQVCGYFWPARHDGWRPDPTLVEFLAAGSPPVFIGFGSLATADGPRLSSLVLETVRKAGVRAVVQAGWAGLDAEGDDVLTIGHVPHDWLLPRMAAVVHHGGAGTTGAALRSGVPQIPVPVAADQPFWAARAHQLGVSPTVLPYRKLTADKLAGAITAAVGRNAYRTAAESVAEHVKAEDGVGRVAEMIQRVTW